MAVVVAVLGTDQIRIGPDKNTELANSCRALPVPDVDGIGVWSLGAPSCQGHKEWSIDAVGTETGNNL